MDNKSIYLDKNLIESIHTFHKILEIIDHLEENLVEAPYENTVFQNYKDDIEKLNDLIYYLVDDNKNLRNSTKKSNYDVTSASIIESFMLLRNFFDTVNIFNNIINCHSLEEHKYQSNQYHSIKEYNKNHIISVINRAIEDYYFNHEIVFEDDYICSYLYRFLNCVNQIKEYNDIILNNKQHDIAYYTNLEEDITLLKEELVYLLDFAEIIGKHMKAQFQNAYSHYMVNLIDWGSFSLLRVCDKLYELVEVKKENANRLSKDYKNALSKYKDSYKDFWEHSYRLDSQNRVNAFFEIKTRRENGFQCEECGHELNPNDKFCSYCGYNVNPMELEESNNSIKNTFKFFKTESKKLRELMNFELENSDKTMNWYVFITFIWFPIVIVYRLFSLLKFSFVTYDTFGSFPTEYEVYILYEILIKILQIACIYNLKRFRKIGLYMIILYFVIFIFTPVTLTLISEDIAGYKSVYESLLVFFIIGMPNILYFFKRRHLFKY